MASKYPTFERVTAGRLRVGDEILIRDRKSDHLPDMHELSGEFQVRDIASFLRPSGMRSTRYYTLMLGVGEEIPAAHVVTVSQVQRVNKIIR